MKVSFSEKFVSHLFRNRGKWLLLILGVTALFGASLYRITVGSMFADMLPQGHPFIKTYNRFRKTFGGANLVLVMLEKKGGEIYTPETLRKIERITETIDGLEGVNHYQVFSITQRKCKITTATGSFVEQKALIWPEVQEDPEWLAGVKANVTKSPMIYQQYVSEDHRSTLITAEFLEGKVDYPYIFQNLREMMELEEDASHSIYIAGAPMLVGWIRSHFQMLLFIFGLTIAVIVILLYVHFRSFLCMFLPLLSGVVSAIWGLGFAVSFGFTLDPLIMVVPLLITARAVSHSVQLLERFEELVRAGHSASRALHLSSVSLFSPGVLGVTTDALGILTIAVATIPMMQKLAFFCSFWAFSIIITVQLLNPLILSYFGRIAVANISKKTTGAGFCDRFTRVISRCTEGKIAPRAVVVIGFLLIVFGAFVSSKTTIGDVTPGTPILWPKSHYNRSVGKINDNFRGSVPLYIFLEGDEPFSLADPKVARTVEKFQRHLERNTPTSGTVTYVDFIREFHEMMREGDPKWGLIPSHKGEVAHHLGSIADKSEPGDFERFMDMKYQNAVVRAFYQDQRGETIENVLREAEAFIEDHPMPGAKFTLAGGMMGVVAAINQEVDYSHRANFIVILAAILILSSLTFRSIVGGIFVVIPLLLSTLLVFSYMVWQGIGLNVNTLPVGAVGIGIGVDYGIYILSRILEERRREPNLSVAVRQAVLTTGKAIFFTAMTLVGGVIFWYFLSPIRFQAEMGLLLALLMILNMIGAMLMIPALVLVFKRPSGGYVPPAG